METKDTAVALLKEWKYANRQRKGKGGGKNFHEIVEQLFDDISRRLDEKAEAAGISIINGRFVQNYALLNVDHTPHGSTCWLDLPAREQQAIQEWLLIKNEEKTA